MRLILLILLLTISPFVRAVDFDAAILITQHFEEISFARNPQNAIQITDDGTVHLVYTIADTSVPVPNTSIYYQSIQNGLINGPVRINSSGTNANHPAMKIGEDGIVHVVWQDSRHSTPSGNWVDNIEIYYDRKSPEGDFLDNDNRITKTQANHLGDNGFAPQLEITDNGIIHIVWYDFHTNGNNADVYLRSSDSEGDFPAVEGIDEFRITNIETGDNFLSHWLPTISGFADGLYVLWGFQEGFTTIFEMQGMEITGSNQKDIETIGKGGKLLDPLRLASDHQGNIGCVYGNIVENQSVIEFRYRTETTDWSKPLRVNSGFNHATQPHLAFDLDGNAHAVWQEDIGGVFEIRYAEIDPVTMSIITQQKFSNEESDRRTPVIGINPQTSRIHIAWIDHWPLEGRAVYLMQETVTSILEWNQID